ncbi:MAG TPA: hypothetical protein VFI31_27460 [Pirellulales bacterium]|nr:hypothetical protein [Pirellulales bacterium]
MPVANNDSAVATFAFTIILDGLDDINEDLANRLFEAGCDDAMLGCCDGVVSLEFDRDSDSLGEAVKTALRDIQAAGCSPAEIRFSDGATDGPNT